MPNIAVVAAILGIFASLISALIVVFQIRLGENTRSRKLIDRTEENRKEVDLLLHNLKVRFGTSYQQQGGEGDEGKRIIDALNRVGANKPCPRCSNETFSLVPGYFNQMFQSDPKDIIIGGPGLSTIAVACTNCGFMAHHAIDVLKLYPKDGVLHEAVQHE